MSLDATSLDFILIKKKKTIEGMHNYLAIRMFITYIKNIRNSY
jgi:hypothetical protein